jgi:hypothetical protein
MVGSTERPGGDRRAASAGYAAAPRGHEKTTPAATEGAVAWSGSYALRS